MGFDDLPLMSSNRDTNENEKKKDLFEINIYIDRKLGLSFWWIDKIDLFLKYFSFQKFTYVLGYDLPKKKNKTKP